MNEMTIFPDAPEVKEVAKLLLELADHPRDVRTTLDPTVGFIVPQWLYELFVETWSLRLGVDAPAPVLAEPDEPSEPAIEAAPERSEPETPARRKPGRPRKEDQ